MDFAFTSDQQALRDLADQLFGDHASDAALRRLEAEGRWTPEPLWAALGASGLLGVAVPAEHGGSGLGVLDLCLLLERQGAHVAPAPLWASLCLGALPLARFGTADARASLLPKVATGEAALTAALHEEGIADPAEPATTARRDGDGWVLDGVKDGVPAVDRADLVWVPAAAEGGRTAVFGVSPRAAGVAVEAQTGTNGEPLGRMRLDGVRVGPGDALGGPDGGAEVVRWTLERAQLGLCALTLGLCDRALAMTARYTSERRQFDRPIATFQAVAQRVGDAFVDVEAARVTLWRAAWLVDQGREASREVAVAKVFASEAGHRVLGAAQHLHGGMGFDRDYPLYRYYLWAKQVEFCLGSTGSHLASLGDRLAEGR